MPKIKIEKSLYQKIQEYSDLMGYSSPKEFIIHLIEKEIKQLENSENDPDFTDRLKGLGYLS